MIALVTDSNAQLPAEVAARLGVVVVPIGIVIDGVHHREAVDIDVDDFYELLAAGAEVTTSQPSPGEFAAAYERVEGAHAVVSIHVGADLSGTCNSARLAAATAVPDVRIVDTGQTSFSVAACVLEAARARDGGADVDGVVAAARATAAELRNVFVMDGVDLGRAAARGAVDDAARVGEGRPVLELVGSALDVVGHAGGVEDAAELMAGRVLAGAGPVRTAVGAGDRRTVPVADSLAALLDRAPSLIEVIRYRCGPSVGAFAGPGVAGAVWWPASP